MKGASYKKVMSEILNEMIISCPPPNLEEYRSLFSAEASGSEMNNIT
jgi:hypothetical protein